VASPEPDLYAGLIFWALEHAFGEPPWTIPPIDVGLGPGDEVLYQVVIGDVDWMGRGQEGLVALPMLGEKD
jgi:hypothetical protein